MDNLIPYRNNRNLRNRGGFPSLWDDSFFRSFFDMNDWMGGAGFRVEVREEKDQYLLEAELPGLSKDQITVTFGNETLTISAEFQSGDSQDKSYYYSERRMGHVSRSFMLNNIDEQKITADYQNGMLTVFLPKAHQDQAKEEYRQIAIGNSGDPASKS